MRDSCRLLQELLTLVAMKPEFEARNAVIIGLSVDPGECAACVYIRPALRTEVFAYLWWAVPNPWLLLCVVSSTSQDACRVGAFD